MDMEASSRGLAEMKVEDGTSKGRLGVGEEGRCTLRNARRSRIERGGRGSGGIGVDRWGVGGLRKLLLLLLRVG